MKLIRCNVSSFGTLKDFQYDFRERFDCVLRENGSGKTTLAAFILAMLYGMETVRSTDRELRDRARYAPWSGGRYGGALELSCGARIYRIERTFDRQSAAKDQLRVYDLTAGSIETALEPTPGDALLGIPRDAFLRTAFVGGRESGNLGGLLPKINAVTGGESEPDLWETASELLQKQRRRYKADRGKSGSIEDLQNERKTAEKELRLCVASKESAEEHEALKKSAEQRAKAIAGRLSLVIAGREALLRRRTHEELLVKQRASKEALNGFCASLHSRGVPTDAENERFRDQIYKIGYYRDRLSQPPLEEGERAEKKRLDGYFDGRSTSEEEIDEMRALISQISYDTQKKREAQRLTESEEFKALSERFSHDCPDEQTLQELRALETEYLDAGKKYEESKKRALIAENNRKAAPKTLSKRAMIAGGAGILLFALSILFFALSLPAPWVFLLLGAAALGYAVYNYLTSDKKAPEETPERDDGCEERYKEAARTLGDRLGGYGYFGEDLPRLLVNLIADRATYLEKKQTYTRTEQTVRELCARINENERALNAFKERFPDRFEGDPDLGLRLLREDLKRREEISKKLADAAKKRDQDERTLKELESAFAKELSPYADMPQPGEERALIEELTARTRSFGLLSGDYAARKKDAEEYAASHPYTDLPDDIPDEEETERLQNELPVLQGLIAQTEKKIEEENRIADRASEYRSRIAQLDEEIGKQTREYYLLTSARNFLEIAQGELRGKYTAPLRAAYARYAEKIDRSLCENFTFSQSDLSLSYEREGEYRRIDAFSSGFTALSDICMRLALIDVAYPDERPFLILDDPFAFLDDENLRRALAALKDLSDSTQILYFTCHSDRATQA